MHLLFDRNALTIKPLSERKHDLDISCIKKLESGYSLRRNRKLETVAERIIEAKKRKASVIMMIGAHVIRSGVQRFIIDLMEKGYISCIAMNGAGIIHDFEFALIGATTESVSRYIREGQFGLWRETALLNDIINRAYCTDKNASLGRAVGQYVENSNIAFKSISILACAYRLGIPATVHVGIGYDILHEHPNCDGAATGALSYNDFLFFAREVEELEHGVIMNFGSAVMAPEIFLKALSMARNVAIPRGKEIRHFTSLVCDLARLPRNVTSEPQKDSSSYYFRPHKTLLIRTVADGGQGFYVRGPHAVTIPGLWAAISYKEGKNGESS